MIVNKYFIDKLFKQARAHLFAQVKWFQVLLSNTNNSTSAICLQTVKWLYKWLVSELFKGLVGFDGISTIVGYLMPNPL